MQNNCRGFSTLLIGITILLVACNSRDTTAGNTGAPAETDSIQLVFDKLVGTWLNKEQESFERWTKNDDGTYQSVVFTVKGKDTVINEQAKIYPENNQWIFDNLVKGQNSGKSVRFTSSALTANSVQFSNPAHDFPNDIHYAVPDENTVNAFIAGKNEKGGRDTIPFTYSRVR
jgi:hypothetical protein